MLNGPRSRILAEGLRGVALLLVLPIVLLAAAYLVGVSLPEDHTATATGLVEAPPARVWELLTDIAAQSSWRETPVVLFRDPLQPSAVDPCWYEAWLLTKFRLCAADTGQTHRVVQIAGPFYPFEATWTFDLAPAPGNRTTLTITEDATIDRPLWRFLGACVLRRHTAVAFYLERLQHEAAHHP